jgi:hypothetical protein
LSFDQIDSAVRDRIVAGVARAFTAILRPRRYKRSNITWRVRNPDTLLMVNIQRSIWGGEFYINLAVLFLAVEDLKQPREYDCHVRARLDLPAADPNYSSFQRARHYEVDLDDNDRASILVRALSETGLPFLDQFETLDGALSAIQNLPSLLPAVVTQNVYDHYAVKRPARALP